MIRIRWYGGFFPSPADLFPVPKSPSHPVFVERKTHHEGAPSVKERFKLPLSDLPAVLTGLTNTDEYLAEQAQAAAKKQARAAPVAVDSQAAPPPAAASGSAPPETKKKAAGKEDEEGGGGGSAGDKLAYAQNLAREVQSSVLTKGLRPVCRTVYHRTAFQSAANNEVWAKHTLGFFLGPK